MVMTQTVAGDADALVAAGRLRDAVTPEADGTDLFFASGLTGITVPAAFGGPQCSVETLTEVHRLLASASIPLARLLHGHTMFLRALTEQGTPGQQDYFFAQALAGACFADLGTVSPVPLTLCRWRNGVYRLDGESSGEIRSDWLVARAVLVDELAEETDEPDEVLAVVRRDELGITTDSSGTIRLDGVHVAAVGVVPWSTLFDRPTTFRARADVTRQALDPGADRAGLRETARAIDAAELTGPPLASGRLGM
ncbi:hypothetical protein GCM10022223_03540 [Kineosporia mesophila]|uniref:Acyl-CoA dehydrogenase/oxidase N-terminal domain-containing protein n=1 Tax=Kineosporia mesophila TaxID=566012 RepID=A0ABP6YWL2_9ACTN|nr:acyl-CoA dehydrogenase family protein [Kineosporia mesophila]MCD5351838.1 acyl-CoA dehydrogenase family protein [Kineosporia mesophila]